MASTHLPSLTKQVRDLHSPIPSQAVPSQHLYPTHLQHSPGSFSSPWSPPQAAAYQPLLVVPATATGVQGSRAGGGGGLVLLGAVPWDTFTRRYLHQLSVHVTRLDMPRGAFFMSCNFHLHISHRLRCGKSRSLFLFGVSLYSLLYSLLYYVHWHYNCLAQGYHFSLSTCHKRAPALL